jgi:DNA mismatch repair ATPase MutS
MLKHWREVKAQRPDTILFYRVGDFYEKKFSPGPRAAPAPAQVASAEQLVGV